MATSTFLAVVASPELVFFTVVGGVLAVLGGAMVSDVAGFGEWLVERAIPKALRMGSADADRRKFGWGYLLEGLAVAVICLSQLL